MKLVSEPLVAVTRKDGSRDSARPLAPPGIYVLRELQLASGPVARSPGSAANGPFVQLLVTGSAPPRASKRQMLMSQLRFDVLIVGGTFGTSCAFDTDVLRPKHVTRINVEPSPRRPSCSQLHQFLFCTQCAVLREECVYLLIPFHSCQYCLSGHPTLPCNVLKFKSTTIMLDCGLDTTSVLNFLPLPLVHRWDSSISTVKLPTQALAMFLTSLFPLFFFYLSARGSPSCQVGSPRMAQ